MNLKTINWLMIKSYPLRVQRSTISKKRAPLALDAMYDEDLLIGAIWPWVKDGASR